MKAQPPKMAKWLSEWLGGPQGLMMHFMIEVHHLSLRGIRGLLPEREGKETRNADESRHA